MTISWDDSELSCETYDIFISSDDVISSHEMMIVKVLWDVSISSQEPKNNLLKRCWDYHLRRCWLTVSRYDMFTSHETLTSIVIWDDISLSREMIWNHHMRHIYFSSHVIILFHLTRLWLSTFHVMILIISWDDCKPGKSSHKIFDSWDDPNIALWEEMQPSHEVIIF